MSSRNIGAVALVIALGLLAGTLGLVAADLYAVGVLILFLGGVGVAVLAGEYLIRYVSNRRPQPPA
jgi:type IV secretory pathway TrbD component